MRFDEREMIMQLRMKSFMARKPHFSQNGEITKRKVKRIKDFIVPPRQRYLDHYRVIQLSRRLRVRIEKRSRKPMSSAQRPDT